MNRLSFRYSKTKLETKVSLECEWLIRKERINPSPPWGTIWKPSRHH